MVGKHTRMVWNERNYDCNTFRDHCDVAINFVPIRKIVDCIVAGEYVDFVDYSLDDDGWICCSSAELCLSAGGKYYCRYWLGGIKLYYCCGKMVCRSEFCGSGREGCVV